MKTLKLVESDKELQKRISKDAYYTNERFIDDAKRYIKAIKEGRVICSIGSVSNSGMSRTMKFVECTRNRSLKAYQYYNFFAFFKSLGFTQAKGRKLEDYFTIGGCGMDMIFHTNYTIIHRLERLGFITKEVCAKLAQATPTVI